MGAQTSYGVRHDNTGYPHPAESELELFVFHHRRGKDTVAIRQHLHECEFCAARVEYISQQIGPICVQAPDAAASPMLPECLNHPERFAAMALAMLALMAFEMTPLHNSAPAMLKNHSFADLMDGSRSARLASLPFDRGLESTLLDWTNLHVRGALSYVQKPRNDEQVHPIFQPPAPRKTTSLAVADFNILPIPDLKIQTEPPADILPFDEPQVPAPRHSKFVQALSNIWKVPKKFFTAKRPDYDDTM